MADVLTPDQRHLNMARIRSKDTGIEKQVRTAVATAIWLTSIMAAEL